MEADEFCKKFKDLDSRRGSLEKILKHAKDQREKWDEEADTLKRRMEEIDEIKAAIEGLKKKNHYRDDPGKYWPAYYFVKEMYADDAENSHIPSLFKPCPDCKKEQPVIMRYEQIYDSPSGDVWGKDIFLICDKDQKIYSLAQFRENGRF